MKSTAFFLFCFLGLGLMVTGQTPTLGGSLLSLGPTDLRIEQSNDGGYILFVRKKPGIESVVLTESTKDPDNKLASYSLRSKTLHPINGIQRKKLDSQFIDTSNLFFLMSSEAVDDPKFGKAFKVFIPYVVIYGFPGSRYGEIQIQDGAYLSIRAFGLPFADYSAGFLDNPYLLKLSQVAVQGTPSGYNKETIRTFDSYAALNDGKVRYSKGEDDLLKILKDLLDSIKEDVIDLALCLDATQSMDNDAVFVREKLVPLLRDFAKGHVGSRFAIVQYRDYMEDFLYKVTPFGNDFGLIQTAIDQYRPAGGRDIPEAVNEALYASLTELDWVAKMRLLVLVGDAPPHPIPRGTVTEDMVGKEARKKNVIINPIILPN